MTEKQERILIVDDEKQVRQIIYRRLSSEGYHCQEAANAEQALDELKKKSIGLVILDVKMPGKSGIQFLPEIRERYPDTAVIMATVITDTHTAIQCIRQGAYDFITKPFNLDEIVMSVERALEMRRLRLIESREQYKTIFESANDVLLFLDRQGTILDINEKLKEIGGYEREEFVGKNFRSLAKIMSKKSLAVILKNFLKRIAGFNVLPYTVEMFTKNGKSLTIEINAVAIRRGDKIIGDLAILRDVTERKLAEHTVRERNKELTCLYKLSQVIAKPEADLDEILKETVELIPSGWQYPKITCAKITLYGSEFETRNFADTKWKQSADIIVTGNKQGSVDVYYVKERPEIDEGPFLKEERNLINGIARMLSEIIERKEADKAQKESEQNLLSLLDSMDDLVFVINPDGAFERYYQPSHVGDLYVPPSEFLGKHFKDVLPPDVVEQLQAAINAIKTSGETQQFEYTLEMRGVKEWSDARISPIKNQSGDITAFTVVSRDVTERKQAEERVTQLYEQVRTFNIELEEKIRERTKELAIVVKDAEAANQAKTDFLANMSHELRTPLNAIIGFSQLLREQYFGDLNEKQAEYVSDILESGEHLLSLINDILDLSKIEAGKMELELSRVKIEDLLKNSLVMVKERSLVHRISLDTHDTEGLEGLEVIADERRLKQVMFNLLSNAVKFTPDGGTITVKGNKEGKEVIISVSDTGVGILPEEQEKIFEEFYQVSSTIKGKTSGTGLGLPLTKRIVEMHGGRIWVKSQGPGKGSQFYFTLPV